MPYQTVDDLPKAVRDKYPAEGQRAFLAAFNSTYDKCSKDGGEDCESRSMAAGHSAAQRAGEVKAIDFTPVIDVPSQSTWDAIKGFFKREKPMLPGFKMLPDNRWIAWYSNAFGPDKDGEFIADKAIEADVSRMIKTEDFPELWFFHLKATRHGKADTVGKIGRFAVASGTFDTGEIADEFKRFYSQHEGEIAMSFGFDYEPAQKTGGVYNHIRTFEVSTVWPAQYAANPYTVFHIFQEVKAMTNQLESLRKVFTDPEQLQGLIDQTEETTKVLEGMVAFKGLLEQIQERTETPAQEEAAKVDVLTRDEAMKMMEDMKMGVVEEVKSIMAKLMTEKQENSMAEDEEKPKPEEEMKAAQPDPVLMATLQKLFVEADAQIGEAKKVSELGFEDSIAFMLNPAQFGKKV